MDMGCSLEYPTQEPPTATHYAKGNMSLAITNGTAKMQPITHGHTQGWLLHET